MTLWIVHDEPGGAQREVLNKAARMAAPLWIAVDQEPPDTGLYDLWIDQRWESIAAAAARLAHREVSGNDLVISTLNGFGGEAQRRVVLEDHSDITLQFVTALRHPPPDFRPPAQIILAGLSMAYDRALARISGTLPKAAIERGVELIQGIAGSALTHVLWDLERSRIPVLVSCWDTTQSKRRIPHIPMGCRNVASRTVLASEFPYKEWEEILSDVNTNTHHN